MKGKFLNSALAKIITSLIIVLVLVLVVTVGANFINKSDDSVLDASFNSEPATVMCSIEPSLSNVIATEPKIVKSHKIKDVPFKWQSNALSSACETYACIMLLQYLDFDINEYKFVDEYLVIKPVYYGWNGGSGPDMDSAFAGDISNGYGINASGMAKCMNKYLKTTTSDLRAYSIKKVSIDYLCQEYIAKDMPVMIWATENMCEPHIGATWTINYADDDSYYKVGDTVNWLRGEHCLLLVGFDEDYYYFNDSLSGQYVPYSKSLVQDRYEKIGSQAIFLK